MQRGDSLAISAELVDAQKDDQIWGQQYNRKASDIHAPGRDREGNHHNAAAALNNRRREAHAGGQVIEQHQATMATSRKVQKFFQKRATWSAEGGPPRSGAAANAMR